MTRLLARLLNPAAALTHRLLNHLDPAHFVDQITPKDD